MYALQIKSSASKLRDWNWTISMQLHHNRQLLGAAFRIQSACSYDFLQPLEARCRGALLMGAKIAHP